MIKISMRIKTFCEMCYKNKFIKEKKNIGLCEFLITFIDGTQLSVNIRGGVVA